MGRAAFSQAVATLSTAGAGDEDHAFQVLQRLERVILDHRPASPREAVSILDVIIPDIAAGGRSDGRDVSALVNIRGLLTSLEA